MQVELMGSQTSTPATFQNFRKVPYSIYVAQLQVTVGAVIVAILAAPLVSTSSYWVGLQNVSLGGQNIRFGLAPAFGANPAGILLPPAADDSNRIILEDWGAVINAIADGAGALLNVLIARTNT